jgi:hypothetical protein
MRRNRTAGAGSRKGKAGGVTPAGLPPLSVYCLKPNFLVLFMADTLEQDVRALKEWLRRLAVPRRSIEYAF